MTGDEVSLKEYILDILREREKTHRAEAEANARALVIATDEVKRRIHEANGVKADILEHKADYVSKSGFEPWQKSVDKALTTYDTKADSKYKTYTIFVTILTIVFLAIQIFVIIFTRAR